MKPTTCKAYIAIESLDPTDRTPTTPWDTPGQIFCLGRETILSQDGRVLSARFFMADPRGIYGNCDGSWREPVGWRGTTCGREVWALGVWRTAGTGRTPRRLYAILERPTQAQIEEAQRAAAEAEREAERVTREGLLAAQRAALEDVRHLL